MSDLVVGEAVVLEMRLARLASRGLALALDLAAQLVALVLGALLIGGIALNVDEALAAALILVFYVLVILGYPVAFETITRGRSLGKLAFGLRVVRDDGGPIRFRHALVRGLLGVVEFWLFFGALALIVSLASSRGKRLGDFLAGTVVVRERMPGSGTQMAFMPPQLAGWAASLDLSRLPDDLALAARQFLSRANDLTPEVREQMGGRIASAVAAVTTPAAPPGVPAWAFLSAVLAERRRRELARLQPAQPFGYPGQPYPAPYPVGAHPYPPGQPPYVPWPPRQPSGAPAYPPPPPYQPAPPPGSAGQADPEGEQRGPFAPPS